MCPPCYFTCAGLPSPTVSWWLPMEDAARLAPLALVVMVVDLLESTSIARALAAKCKYELNANQVGKAAPREAAAYETWRAAHRLSRLCADTNAHVRVAGNRRPGAGQLCRECLQRVQHHRQLQPQRSQLRLRSVATPAWGCAAADASDGPELHMANPPQEQSLLPPELCCVAQQPAKQTAAVLTSPFWSCRCKDRPVRLCDWLCGGPGVAGNDACV